MLEGKGCGVLVNDFKGHSKPFLKEYVTRFLGGNDRTPEQERYRICEWLIMAGRITCKIQPINMLLGECFTVQLSCLKSRRKIRPIIIFKGAPTHAHSSTISIAVEIRDRLPYNSGNIFPARNKIRVNTTKTSNSTGEVTMDCLRDVIFPEIGVLEGERCGILVDDFKGHSKPLLKEFMTSFLSGNDRTPEQERYRLF